MTSGELAKLLGVSDQTIRNWSDLWAAHLSPEATPPVSADGPRPLRRYTTDDAAVLALVARMRSEARTQQEIGEALERGERGELPREASEGTADSWQAAELPPAPVLLVELRTAQIELRHAVEERDRARGELAEERAARLEALERAARAEGRLEEREAREAPGVPVEEGSVAPREDQREPRGFWARLFGRQS